MKLVFALALGSVAVGCAKKKEEPKVKPPTSLFETVDLEAASPYQLTATEVGGEVANAAYDLAPSDETEDADKPESCFDKKLDALAYAADKANAIVEATIDLKDCAVFDEEAGTKLEYPVAEAKVLIWFGCKNDDIEDLDGKLLGEISNDDSALAYCKSEQDVQVMSNLLINVEAQGKNADGDAIEGKVKLIEAVQTKDGDPCAATYADGDWTWTDGCASVIRSVFSDGEDYVGMTYNGIVESHDPQPWFKAGFLDFKINNWTGKLTFAGGDAAPTYEMTDGGVTRSGTVNGFALSGRSLADKIHRHGIKIKL